MYNIYIEEKKQKDIEKKKKEELKFLKYRKKFKKAFKSSPLTMLAALIMKKQINWALVVVLIVLGVAIIVGIVIAVGAVAAANADVALLAAVL